MSLVLDASVAAKYLLPEHETDKARTLLARWQEGRFELAAPDHLLSEVANALWKAANRGLLERSEARRLFDHFHDMQVPLVASQRLSKAALRLALEYRHTVYDGLYVALALETGWDFVTADRKLHGLLASKFPQVRLLAEWV